MAREVADPGAAPRIAVDPQIAEGIFGIFSSTFAALGQSMREKARTLNILKARREGAIAGTEGSSEIRKGVSAKAQAFNDAASQTMFNSLQVQIAQELAQNEVDNPLDGPAFNELSNQFINESVSQLNARDQVLGSALKSRAENLRLSAALRIRSATVSNSREEILASITENEVMNLGVIRQELQSFFSEDSDMVANAGEAVLTAYADMERMWASPDPGGLGSLLSPNEIVSRRVTTIRNIYEQAISGFIRNHERPGEVEDALKSGEFAMPTLGVNQLGEVLKEGEITALNPKRDLPPEIFNRLVALARAEQGRRNQDEAGERERIRSLAVQTRDAILAELQGPEPVSSLVLTDDQALAITRGDPVGAGRIQDEIANEREIASFVPLINAESVAATQDRIDGQEVKGLDAPEELQMLKFLQAAQSRKITALENDPFLYAQSIEPGKDLTSAFQSGAMDEPTYRRLMIDLQSASATGLRGFFPSAMNKDEAAEFVGAYSQIRTPQEMTQAVQSLQAKFGTGDLLESALNDFKDAGFPKAALMLASMDSRSRAAQLLVHAMQVGTSELNKQMKDSMSPEDLDAQIDGELFEFVSALPPNNITLIESTREAARLIARGAIVFDQNTSRSDVARIARKALVDSRWVIENETLIILGKDTEQVKAAVTSRGLDALIDLFADRIDPALDDKTSTAKFDFIEQLREDGRLVPDEKGEGLEMMDGPHGRPVLLSDGTKLLARFDKELFDVGETIIVDSVSRVRSEAVHPALGPESFRRQDVRAQRQQEREAATRAELVADARRNAPNDLIQDLNRRGVSLPEINNMTIEEMRQKKQELDAEEIKTLRE